MCQNFTQQMAFQSLWMRPLAVDATLFSPSVSRKTVMDKQAPFYKPQKLAKSVLKFNFETLKSKCWLKSQGNHSRVEANVREICTTFHITSLRLVNNFSPDAVAAVAICRLEPITKALQEVEGGPTTWGSLSYSTKSLEAFMYSTICPLAKSTKLLLEQGTKFTLANLRLQKRSKKN